MHSELERTATALQPPAPAEIERKLKFYRLQALGVPIIAMIPILALFKVFDTTRASAEATNGGLTIETTYPAKLRHRTFQPMKVTVANTGTSPAREVTLEIDSAYIDQFREVDFEPSPDAIDRTAYRFDLGHLAPGDVRHVELMFQSDDLGTHRGFARAAAADGAAEVRFSTFVLP